MPPSQLRITINEEDPYLVRASNGQLIVGDDGFAAAAQRVDAYHIQVELPGVSHTVLVDNYERGSQTFHLRIRGKDVRLSVRSRLDELRELIGAGKQAATTLVEVKAPMPGKIRSVEVASGQQVAKGDALLVLEAMKMENVLKAPAAGLIAAVLVAPGDAVEKGQALLRF